MITSRERSKLWVERELPGSAGLIDSLWNNWCLDDCPAGLDYFLLHCGAALGLRQTRDWVSLCSQDLSAREVKDLSPSDALLLLDRMELLWRRRLRSSPGWETHRAAWVNLVNRVMRRTRDLAQENSLLCEKESSCVI